MFLRNHHSYDWTAVDGECLKELGSLPESFRMLNDDAHGAGTCTIGNLYPVSTETDKLVG